VQTNQNKRAQAAEPGSPLSEEYPRETDPYPEGKGVGPKGEIVRDFPAEMTERREQEDSACLLDREVILR